MLKPEEGSQGKGITLHDSFNSIRTQLMSSSVEYFPCKDQLEIPASERYLVQEYIDKPLLLKVCKFDLRGYMLIARSTPYVVFFHEGYLRRALGKYTPSTKNRRSILTNTHYQSMHPDFKLSDHIWFLKPFKTIFVAVI